MHRFFDLAYLRLDARNAKASWKLVVFTPKYVDLANKLTNKNHKISLKTRITRRQFLKPTLYQPRRDRFKSKEDMDSLCTSLPRSLIVHRQASILHLSVVPYVSVVVYPTYTLCYVGFKNEGSGKICYLLRHQCG